MSNQDSRKRLFEEEAVDRSDEYSIAFAFGAVAVGLLNLIGYPDLAVLAGVVFLGSMAIQFRLRLGLSVIDWEEKR